MDKRRQEAHPESVLLALHALGAPVATMKDVASALKEKVDAQKRRTVEPVVVVWDGVHIQHPKLPTNSKATLLLEDGSTSAWSRGPLPFGYHRLHVTTRGSTHESLVISAPRRANFPFFGKVSGVFAPVYALHSKRTRGAGDLTDLATLIEWTAQRGGNVVSTLPMLATFLDQPFEPSPYSPISRLFWNEFYLDLEKVPEFSRALEAREIFNAIPSGNSRSLVDYRGTMRVKRRVLEALSRFFFAESGHDRREDLNRFLLENPEVLEYARFRARTDLARRGWHDWPGGNAEPDHRLEQYHLYAQWLIQDQLHGLSQRSRAANCMLYLDLPLGLHRDSFDAWRYPQLFVKGMSGGAPPDPVFTTGQNWSFQPIHPQAMRKDGYRYAISYLRNHLRYARLLRIDHVMGLHRLYWIPEGFTGERGLYVQYPADEMYAILSLESHRANAGIVGENLGVVPEAVNRAMTLHHVRQLYVAQYETAVNSRKSALRQPTRGSVASLNTHDMFPFQAFLDGTDIHMRLKLGFLTVKEASMEKKRRARVRKALEASFGKNLFTGCMEFLKRSRAGIVLHNLEDLWGETKPQNIPATTSEHANWRRRMRYSMERLRRLETHFSR